MDKIYGVVAKSFKDYQEYVKSTGLGFELFKYIPFHSLEIAMGYEFLKVEELEPISEKDHEFLMTRIRK